MFERYVSGKTRGWNVGDGLGDSMTDGLPGNEVMPGDGGSRVTQATRAVPVDEHHLESPRPSLTPHLRMAL